MRTTNNGQNPKSDAGGGPETRLQLEVALCDHACLIVHVQHFSLVSQLKLVRLMDFVANSGITITVKLFCGKNGMELLSKNIQLQTVYTRGGALKNVTNICNNYVCKIPIVQTKGGPSEQKIIG